MNWEDEGYLLSKRKFKENAKKKSNFLDSAISHSCVM